MLEDLTRGTLQFPPLASHLCGSAKDVLWAGFGCVWLLTAVMLFCRTAQAAHTPHATDASVPVETARGAHQGMLLQLFSVATSPGACQLYIIGPACISVYRTVHPQQTGGVLRTLVQ